MIEDMQEEAKEKEGRDEEDLSKDAPTEEIKDKEETDEDTIEEGDDDANKTEEEEPVEKTPEEEYTELNDKYLRRYSDFDNYRRRSVQEKLDLMSTAASDVFSALLPILDDFDRAKKAIEENPDDLKSIKKGYELIHEKLRKTMIEKGLEEMNSLGKDFDADMYEAVTKIPAPSKKEKGKVVDVLEKGYSISGKIIRFAKVVIGE
ncbi:MAG: nucleotide exchange factor GrpE [Bacteroidetes bacterium]|nr:nucleotide exchange factor GrpE [Bacteroidota bacterium]